VNMPQCIHLEEIPIVTSRGGEIRVFASFATLGSTRLIMGCALLKSGEEISEHVHDYGEEVILVAEGRGSMFIDGREYPLRAGNAVIARQGQKHKVVNREQEDLKLIFASAPLAPSQQQGHRNV
jgi:putative monooxygenase